MEKSDSAHSGRPKVESCNFALYPKDVEIIDTLIRDLGHGRAAVDGNKVIRFLYHHFSELDLFGFAVAQHTIDAKKPGRREDEPIKARRRVEIPVDDREKWERVVKRLAKADLETNQSYVFRGLLRHLPATESLRVPFELFLSEFPDFRYRAGRIMTGRSKAASE
ncbi:MAG: hypothetical protein JWM32_1267 [Verrucomicrobia bacterium]|nr:hypothetical protein [Verrucomicrobiota bacterium]